MGLPNNSIRCKAVWGRQSRLPVAVALLSLLLATSAQAQMRVTLEWDRNADPHTLGYLVSAGLSSGHYIADFNVAAQNSLRLDLPHGGVYYAIVRAYDGRGRFSPPSPEIVIDLTGPPRDPSALRASTSAEHTTLEWSPPVGGGSPLEYLVSVGTSPGAADVVNRYSVGMTHAASGVLPPGVYFARVQAVNLLGAGPPTPDLAFQTHSGLRVQGPTNLSVRWQGAHAVLTWTPPGGGASMPAAYVIEAGSAAGMTNIASINVGGATSYATSVPAGTYFVRVRGISPSGISDPSNEVVVRGAQVPDAPSNLVSSGQGSTVSLTWSAPADQAVSGYVIEAGSAPGRSDVGTLNVGTATAFGTTAAPGVYYVRVRAVNAQGAGAASNEIVVKR